VAPHSKQIIQELSDEIRQLEKYEKAKISRSHGMLSDLQISYLLKEVAEQNLPQEDNLLEFYNKWGKLMPQSMGSSYDLHNQSAENTGDVGDEKPDLRIDDETKD
jgi:hypothetical protein